VFADPPDRSVYSLPLSNPYFIHVSNFNDRPADCSPDLSREKYDMIVMWRRADFSSCKNRGKSFFWPHDNPNGEFPLEDLAGCFFLSDFQRNTYVNLNQKLKDIPYVICGNGIVPEQFSSKKIIVNEPIIKSKDLVDEKSGKVYDTVVEDVEFKKSEITVTLDDDRFFEKENPYSCIYPSNWAWGLPLLIDIWPSIREKFPRATLEIYYGRETYGRLTQRQMERLIRKIEKLGNQGVTEVGKVDHIKLAEAFKNASIMAYPANVTETFSINTVKAQIAGTIPVTTKMGALKETAYSKAPTMKGLDENRTSAFLVPVDKEEYKELLLNTMENIQDFNRREFHDWAKKFTWENCVGEWLNLYNQVLSNK